MTKKELITLTKEVREKIEKLRTEMTSAIESASETDGDVYNIPYEEDCECDSAFIDLCNALDDFVQRLEEGQDLPAGTLVMCKARESDLEGWRVQRYLKKGITFGCKDDLAQHSGWLYIVPMKYFHPTSTDWLPEEKYNWAKFGEGEE